VQTALQQVEAALLARQGALARIESGTRARQAARAAQAQAETLYRVGLTNYLDVADAQRGALAAQRLLLQAQADAAVASVGVFEAMGVMPGR
jgi:outer membrane protein TolC